MKRFWDKVDRRGSDECWPWMAGTNGKGYGMFQVDGKACRAHRIAWSLTSGLGIPPLAVIRHECDNSICCNPAHLLVGTQADNVRDMDDRGRRGSYDQRGENHPSVHLTEDGIREIRRRLKLHHAQRIIASDFGVAQMTISDIATGKTWSHVS